METRRILLEGATTPVHIEGGELVAGDGRRVPESEARHLPPVQPTKILCVHPNYTSRVDEFGAKLPKAPTYFHEPTSSLNAQGSDTLCPIGPGLVTDWDFRDKGIRTLVNREVKQDGSTSEMKFDMHYLVADLARDITLCPGDVVFSGTPANSRPVEPGDVVTVEVKGLGALTNTIVEGPTPIREDVGAQPSESEEVISTAFGVDWEFRGIRSPRKAE